MQLKRAISLVLAIVLALTILPVREVGSLIAGNQMQEELPHDCGGKTSLGKEAKSTIFYNDFAEFSPSVYLSQTIYFSFTVTLPDHFVGEIQTPPPNFA